MHSQSIHNFDFSFLPLNWLGLVLSDAYFHAMRRRKIHDKLPRKTGRKRNFEFKLRQINM
ncbi:hypothetical protein BofuT4_uP141480.1 [Botrytis cinerea T4]|uniref:Uncharacterized protein n=1 Tax=Botryotinia fuckeliana (strain T4) TaxID=999810 RepID=G2YZ38_BOTF4|nr:hypothetical protein BofuT4_uP141480.1 [Botrytis cinerea T4]